MKINFGPGINLALLVSQLGNKRLRKQTQRDKKDLLKDLEHELKEAKLTRDFLHAGNFQE